MMKKLLFTLLMTSCFTALNAQNGSICIEVYNDLNGNGIMEDTETGMEGITITLTGAPASFTSSVPYGMTTDAAGISCLNDLGYGQYSFMVDLPEGYAVSDQSEPYFIITVDEENVANSYRIGLSNSLLLPKLTTPLFTIYADSAGGLLYVKMAGSERGQVVLYDMSGKFITRNLITSADSKVSIDQLQEGIYVAQVTTDGKSGSLKFAVKK